MSARQQLIAALSRPAPGRVATLQDIAHAEQLVDAYRAEVLRELKEKDTRGQTAPQGESTPPALPPRPRKLPGSAFDDARSKPGISAFFSWAQHARDALAERRAVQ
ncbi:hypothetical protein AB0H29_08225 [Streptomyces thermolilacinus]